MELEFPTFAEFAKACTETDKVWTSYWDAETHRWFGDIEDTVFAESKAIRFIWPVDKMNEVFTLRKLQDQSKDEGPRQTM